MGLVGGATTPWLLALLVISITAVAGEAVISNGGSGRSLLGFRETVHNVSFHCSPSGPCIPCEYSEKWLGVVGLDLDSVLVIYFSKYRDELIRSGK